MKNEIRSYLSSKFGPSAVRDVADAQSLLEAGVIDSAGMVDLIAHLEKTYEIQVDEDEMTPENFDSISAIADYVHGKRKGASSSE